MLQKVAENNDLALCWVLGHFGIEGNEKVDHLAKHASSTVVYRTEFYCGISIKSIRSG